MNRICSVMVLLAMALGLQARSVTFTAQPVVGEKGKTATIEIAMENDFAVRDFQCFINLPEGISPVMNDRGRPAAEWCGRQADHVFSTNMVGTQCRLVAFSVTASTILPGTGAVLSLPVTLNAAPGEYAVTLTNASASTMDAVDVVSPEFSGTVRVIVYPSAVTLDQTTAEMLIGATTGLRATLSPGDVSETALTWRSADTRVATVDNVGTVKATGVGETEVSVTTVNGLTAVCRVKVNPIMAERVVMSATEAELLVDERMELTATVYPADTTDPLLVWTTGDASVATVDNAGRVTARGVGETVVTATAVSGVAATCRVKVNPVMAEAIEIEGGDMAIYLGETVVARVVFIPANTTDKTVTLTTSDAGVVTVDADGRLTGTGIGHATVTATTVNGVTASVAVEVKEVMVTDITLDRADALLKCGEGLTLTATVHPADATFKAVDWSTTDAAVAAVDGDGNVTAVSRGTAVVTASTPNGLSARCEVKVVVNGDANDNGTVTVGDISVAVNHILEREVPTGFVEYAADANGDGTVTVADLATIAGIILGIEPQRARATGATVPQGAAGFSFHPVTEVTDAVDIAVTNQGESLAMQFDFTRPEGMTVESIELSGENALTHVLAWNDLDAATTRVVIYSPANARFAAGSIARIKFASATDTPREGLVEVSRSLIVDASLGEHEIADAAFGVVTGQNTALDRVEADGAAGNRPLYFDLQGRRIVNPGAGVYIRLQDGVAQKVVLH